MERDERLAVSLTEAAKMLGISRSAAYRAADRGQLPVHQIGSRKVVPLAALQSMLASAWPADDGAG